MRGDWILQVPTELKTSLLQHDVAAQVKRREAREVVVEFGSLPYFFVKSPKHEAVNRSLCIPLFSLRRKYQARYRRVWLRIGERVDTAEYETAIGNQRQAWGRSAMVVVVVLSVKYIRAQKWAWRVRRAYRSYLWGPVNNKHMYEVTAWHG